MNIQDISKRWIHCKEIFSEINSPVSNDEIEQDKSFISTLVSDADLYRGRYVMIVLVELSEYTACTNK